ncbi:uncharacterized protein [Ambystoma mexicanum]|uniref:uncharacterized protein n=1 Tax=Ambystoma mexicanum TaxID=8296 RepID=UPI0037E81BBF
MFSQRLSQTLPSSLRPATVQISRVWRLSGSPMSADKTPARARQCFLRRAFEHFPFGRCERRGRSRSSSSYDVRADSSSDLQGSWTSVDTAGICAVSRSNLQEKMDFSTDEFTDATTQSAVLEPEKASMENYVNGVVLPSSTVFASGHGLDTFALPNLEIQTGNFSRVPEDYQYLKRLGSLTSNSISESGIGASRRPASLSSSPSVSSMEMDVGVDPETGERAFG